MNMKLVFDPSEGKSAVNVWRNLREGFKTRKLLDSRVTTDKPEEIAQDHPRGNASEAQSAGDRHV